MQACKRGACLVANFQNTNPERGRKRARTFAQHSSPTCNFRTRTPKGDGNPARVRQGTQGAHHFRTRTPKGDGNTTPPRDNGASGRAFQNTNPERGRKLAGILSLKAVSLLFQNTNPERGRKLPRLCSHNVRKPNFRTRTPKGDGNDPNPLTLSQAEESDFRTRTPKGDGNLSVMPISSMSSSFQNTNPERGRKLVRILDDVNLFCPISEHEPRKGTETGEAVQAIAVTASSFQNTNPERGRKLPAVGAFAPCADYFRTRTPKGDGNFAL